MVGGKNTPIDVQKDKELQEPSLSEQMRSRLEEGKEFGPRPAAARGRTCAEFGLPKCSPAMGPEKDVATLSTSSFLFLSAMHLTRAKKHLLVFFPNQFLLQLWSTDGTVLL